MHLPVLLKEVLQYLDPRVNDNFVDATLGEGVHSLAILERTAPQGRVLGIEKDQVLFQRIKEKVKDSTDINAQVLKRLILVNDSYTNLARIVKENKFGSIQGILFDLGVCSFHLDESGKGFSFREDEPLDMRFSSQDTLTAAEIINSWPQEEIARILTELGEERYSKRIARAIREKRKKERIITTYQLVEILREVLPADYEHHRIHFATRTFQALRIAVNKELENLEKGLEQSLSILAPGGKIVVISFHSLEDRIVKHFFKKEAQLQHLKILTKRPILPSSEEVEKNRRSRSAKLRAAQVN